MSFKAIIQSSTDRNSCTTTVDKYANNMLSLIETFVLFIKKSNKADSFTINFQSIYRMPTSIQFYF